MSSFAEIIAEITGGHVLLMFVPLAVLAGLFLARRQAQRQELVGSAMNQPENQSPTCWATCPCQHCSGHIEFDGSDFEKGETRTVECPHCHAETAISVTRTANAQILAQSSAKTKAMKGTILDYTIQTNAGLISGDDNQRYSFQGAEWRETGKYPLKGMRVDFAPTEGSATAIYLVQDGSGAASESDGKRNCDHVIAGLLGIFLGFIGIHKFYMGYQKEGIILLLCGTVGWIVIIPPVFSFIAGLIEGVIYLSQTQAQFEKTYITGKKAWF